jgi:hypothetical protein
VTRGPGRQAKDLELLNARETQKRLRETLKLLFELLEEYSPVWYQKHYHDQAELALTTIIPQTQLEGGAGLRPAFRRHK